jgi:chemotaxis protein methyltransferase CheR
MQIAAPLDAATLNSLIELVRQHTGIAMNEKKSMLLERRLQPRMRELGMQCFQDYVARVRDDAGEVQAFVNLVTTNDTAFFRTPAVWDALAQLLPDWHARNPGAVLRIWSAAAATGEEMYSAAILCEEFKRTAPAFRYQVLATDICTSALALAGNGQYGGRSLERLREAYPVLLARYFEPAADDMVRVRAPLKAHVTLRVHNLLTPLAGEPAFDIILLRNVLMYFDEDYQCRILHQVHRSLAPGGRLMLGEQDTLQRLDTPFRFVARHIYRDARDNDA